MQEFIQSPDEQSTSMAGDTGICVEQMPPNTLSCSAPKDCPSSVPVRRSTRLQGLSDNLQELTFTRGIMQKPMAIPQSTDSSPQNDKNQGQIGQDPTSDSLLTTSSLQHTILMKITHRWCEHNQWMTEWKQENWYPCPNHLVRGSFQATWHRMVASNDQGMARSGQNRNLCECWMTPTCQHCLLQMDFLGQTHRDRSAHLQRTISAQGFSQEKGVDYHHFWVPTVK